METKEILTMVLTATTSVITIIGAMYAMLRFMLKDTHKEVELLKEEQNDFKKEMRAVNNRLDGLYRVLLDRTYGKNIPDDLK